MGYRLQLFVLRKHVYTIPDGNGRLLAVWRPVDTINLGRVTRLEKLVNGLRGEDAYERAAICAASIIYDRLVAKLELPSREIFAPPALLYSAYPEDAWTGGQSFSGEAALDCGGSDERRSVCYRYEAPSVYLDPDEQLLLEHNQALALSDADFLTHLSQYILVYGGPLMWVSCEELADWWEEAEKQQVAEWQQLQHDPVAAALFRSWSLRIRALQEVAMRILFVFP